MSVLYSDLKAVQEARQNKFSQALKKSSLVKPLVPKPESSNFKVIALLLVLLVLAVGAAIFFSLRKPPAPVVKTVVLPAKVVKVVKAVNVVKEVKAGKSKTPSKHKSRHKKIKKPADSED